MINKLARAAGLALAFWLCAPAFAVDALSLQAGDGDSGPMVRAALQWRGPTTWVPVPRREVGGYLELSFGAWNNGERVGDVAFASFLRLERFRAPPYFEVGLGAHLLSDRPSREGRRFSTSLQLALHLGAGLRFGDDERYELGLRFSHLSNSGLKKPNPGANFLFLRLSTRLP